MEIIPSIDLRAGQVVRLYQGDYAKTTVYSNDPLDVARRFEQAGAKRLHVVDLDGAKSGTPANLDVIRRIAATARMAVQVGGGIRDVATAKLLVDAGVKRVAFGTAAVEHPEVVREACDRLGVETVIVSVDARDGWVAVKGWMEQSKVQAHELVKSMQALGVRRFMYTDIARDGTLTEPNYVAVSRLIADTGATVLASGGVAAVEHLRALAATGAEGAIVGRALYDGTLDLKAAIAGLQSA